MVIDIGTRRELFVDRYLIERLDGARLKLHEPCSGGVALWFDEPWARPSAACRRKRRRVLRRRTCW